MSCERHRHYVHICRDCRSGGGCDAHRGRGYIGACKDCRRLRRHKSRERIRDCPPPTAMVYPPTRPITEDIRDCMRALRDEFRPSSDGGGGSAKRAQALLDKPSGP